MEKDFAISNYPLLQTEFLYDSKQGMVIFKYFVLIQRHNPDFRIRRARKPKTWPGDKRERFSKVDKDRENLRQDRIFYYSLYRPEIGRNVTKSTWPIIEKARDNFVDEKNTQFDYSMFHYT